MVLISTLSAAVAGFLIGTCFMSGPVLVRWGGAIGWAAIHAVGGVIGGTIGVVTIWALVARGIHIEQFNMLKT